ncbi:hypothetical protein DOTSEDRAFT_71558 [Dothistroma septosporum NZE10]|uniref:Uncharacterized protein n=1 Tax=Dothistroma septosporum (strain NZE10 / CBS 128990) TaxID=675120 RepID=N1PMU7_DOTSN|nr:hypothetical protein DOTSEDRAFT_71558 [Dothistroma septosporum NZE10]
MSAWATAHDVDVLSRLLRIDYTRTLANRPAAVFPCHPFGKELSSVTSNLADIAASHLTRQEWDATNHAQGHALWYHGDHFLNELLYLMIGHEALSNGFVAAVALGGDLERGIRDCASILRNLAVSSDAYWS